LCRFQGVMLDIDEAGVIFPFHHNSYKTKTKKAQQIPCEPIVPYCG